MKAFILAAGLGTRLWPLTLSTPKALVKVDGKPLLLHVLNRLKNAGFSNIVINVHHLAPMIIAWLNENKIQNLKIDISDESNCLNDNAKDNVMLDTGGAVKHAAKLLQDSDPILIHNVDILSNANLNSLWNDAHSLDAALLVSPRPSKRQLLFSPNLRLVGWLNEETGQLKSPYTNLDPTQCLKFAFSGIHVISQSLIQLTLSWPDRFSITDFYIQQCASHNIRAILQPNLQVLDTGKQDGLAQAKSFLHNLKYDL